MAQISEMDDGRRFGEIFGLMEEKGETQEQMRERMLLAAQRKLRNPEVNKFYQLKVGRNDLCPCGSELKFKKCCWGRQNQGEFEIDQTPKNNNG